MDIGLLTLGDLLPDPATGKKLTPAARHRQIVDLGVRAAEMGFDSFSVGEPHLCDYVLSAPPVVLAAVAARTERIRLSTSTFSSRCSTKAGCRRLSSTNPSNDSPKT